jgi:imidazoleglycerol-phosphate dehydratase
MAERNTQSERGLGLHVLEATAEQVRLVRITRESEIEIDLDMTRRPGEEEAISSGLQFFDHMLETIAWQACLHLRVRMQAKRYRLSHVVTEDVGLTLGAALGRLIIERSAEGVDGVGSAEHALDEAWAHALVSFEGRSVATVEREAPGSKLERVEDMLAADLREFFAGLSQGARCTVHVWLRRGDDPHHCWESAYRAFGLALRRSLIANPLRKGSITGIKGTLA